MLLFNNKNLLSRQTRLLSKISTPSISVRFSKNTAKNALKNIGNSSSKTAHHTFTQAKVLVKPTTYTGTKVFRYPTLDKKKPEVCFEVSKKTTENYIFNETATPKKVNLLKKLPIQNSSYNDTLRNLKISTHEDENQKILQDFTENPNRFIDETKSRNIFDVENEACILTDLDLCKISILPERNIKDELQNIKVIIGVKDGQLTEDRHIFVGKIMQIFPDNSVEIFGSIMASGSIQMDKNRKLEYLLESKNRILKDESNLMQAISVPKLILLKAGWNFGLKLSINQDCLTEAMSLVITEKHNPGLVTHLTIIEDCLNKVKTQVKELEEQQEKEKEAILQALSSLLSKTSSGLFDPTKGGQTGTGGTGGTGGNLPPI